MRCLITCSTQAEETHLQAISFIALRGKNRPNVVGCSNDVEVRLTKHADYTAVNLCGRCLDFCNKKCQINEKFIKLFFCGYFFLLQNH